MTMIKLRAKARVKIKVKAETEDEDKVYQILVFGMPVADTILNIKFFS